MPVILAAIQLKSKRHVSVPFERIDADRCSVEALFAKIMDDVMISITVPLKFLQEKSMQTIRFRKSLSHKPRFSPSRSFFFVSIELLEKDRFESPGIYLSVPGRSE